MKIIIAILVFSFLMIIHELGHFLMAKRLGIKAYELSIGMGPKIFGIEKNNTLYNLRLIPFGAYVRFGDEEILEEVEDIEENKEIFSGDDDSKQNSTDFSGVNTVEITQKNREKNLSADNNAQRSLGKEITTKEVSSKEIPSESFFTEGDEFMKNPPLDRIKVVIMGPIVNLVAALLLIIGGIYYSGFPTSTIGMVSENLPAQKAGLEAGDTILAIEGENVSSWSDVIRGLSNPPESKIVELLVKKSNGEEKTLSIQMEEHEGRYMVGISPAFERNLFLSIKYGTLTTIDQSTMMLDTVKQLFIGKANIEEFTGPVGIVTVVGEATEAGWLSVLFLTALLSLNLGILNLIPIPGLDGSKILFYSYEAITKKPLNKTLEMRLTMAGFLLIIGFSIFITYKDILRIFMK